MSVSADNVTLKTKEGRLRNLTLSEVYFYLLEELIR